MHAFLKPRLAPVIAALATVALGLLWRSHRLPLPPAIAKYGGDALWAVMIVFLVRVVRPHLSVGRTAAFSLAFCWVIEFSQIYRAPWIDSIRSTRVGHLVLGSTFNAPDLLAYAIGVGFGAAALWAARRLRQ